MKTSLFSLRGISVQLILFSVLLTSCEKTSNIDMLEEESSGGKSIEEMNNQARFDFSQNIVGIDYSYNPSDGTNKMFYWSTNGITNYGTYVDTDPPGYSPYAFTAATGKTPSDIVEIVTHNPSGAYVNWTYAYYYNGTVSAGWSNDLDINLAPTPYTCPAGYNPSNILGMGVNSSGVIYTWFNDGKVFAGSSMTNLAGVSGPTSYTLPPGKTYSQIIGMAWNRTDDKIYTWYVDSTVSVGTITDLDFYAAPVAFD